MDIRTDHSMSLRRRLTVRFGQNFVYLFYVNNSKRTSFRRVIDNAHKEDYSIKLQRVSVARVFPDCLICHVFLELLCVKSNFSN